MIKYVKGDLIKAALDGNVDVIVHGANCFTTMGAGIALQIRNKFPEAFDEDLKTVSGDRKKLGKISYVKIKDLYIINAYTQYTYWNPNDMLSYDAIKSCMKEVKKLVSGKRIGLPKIGAGLARGNWNKIEKIIEDELSDEQVFVYIL